MKNLKWISLCVPIFALSIILKNKEVMVYGIIAVVIFIIIMWAKESKKAAEDPDVKEATELGIVIWRYRKYQEAWDKIQAIYRAYGVDNQLSNKMVNEIIEKLPNLNEWRRFSQRQSQKSFKSFQDIQKEYDDYLKK